MVDNWDHAAPFGPIGTVVDALVLGPLMRRLLVARNAALLLEAEARSRGIGHANAG